PSVTLVCAGYATSATKHEDGSSSIGLVLKEERQWAHRKDAAMMTVTSEVHDSQPPRIRITWAVLEAAKDPGDEMAIPACRRIIADDRLGWRKHGNPADLRLVYSLAM